REAQAAGDGRRGHDQDVSMRTDAQKPESDGRSGGQIKRFTDFFVDGLPNNGVIGGLQSLRLQGLDFQGDRLNRSRLLHHDAVIVHREGGSENRAAAKNGVDRFFKGTRIKVSFDEIDARLIVGR
ncbi:MAG TPA: hypothetical protein PK090_09900, partial [Smithellaceae bacterium]|nr:hypothetical protein [Smithellaceae bacterium]